MKPVTRTILVILSAFCFSTAHAYDTPGTGVEWTLDSLVTYSAGEVTGAFPEYAVSAMITISAGDRVRIPAGIRIRFLQPAAGFTIDGGLIASGQPESPIVFESPTGLANSWSGVRFQDTSPDSISALINCTIRDATTALNCIDASPTVTGCLFTNNGNPSSSGSGEAVRFSSSSSTFRFNRIINNYQRGMLVRASDLIVENCLFSGSNLAPTSFKNRNHLNIETSGGSDMNIVVRHNEFANGEAGAISLSTLNGGSINGMIEGNHIHDNAFGIASGGFGIDENIGVFIHQNVIEGNNINPNPLVSGSGITVNGETTDAPVITANVIRNNHWGITILSSAKPEMGNLGNADTTDDGRNIFIGNGNSGSTYALYNNTSKFQKAENNYWGSNHADSIEAWIFHQPDDGSLGLVDYLPSDSTAGPRLILSALDCPTESVPVGTEADCNLHITNGGLTDLLISLSDAFGSAKKQRTRFPKPANGGVTLSKAIRALSQSTRLPEGVQTTSASGQRVPRGAIVITDPVNDFLGHTLPVPDLVSPDVSSIDMDFYDIVVLGNFLDVVITFNTSVDTGIIGIISMDTDQDFLTGLFPSLSALGISDTDVGSEYELVFTTSPTLFPTGAGAIVFPSDDTTFTPVGVSLGVNTTSNSISFTVAFGNLEIDDDFNLNVAAGAARTDIVNSVLGGEDFRPSRIPDAAPDVGHGLIGVETNPSWLSMSVKTDTLSTGTVVDVGLRAFAALSPGTYPADLLVGSNDPAAPSVVLPLSLTVIEPELPDVDLAPLAITDTIGTGSGKNISVTLHNPGAGRYRHFILDSAETTWLTVLPVFDEMPAGGSATIDIQLDAAGLTPGTYTANLRVVSNDTLQPVSEVPVRMTVIEIVSVDDVAGNGVPADYALLPNFPNPFNPVTTIRYALPEAADVRLTIYNLLGQKVRTLVDARQNAGVFDVQWNGKNDRGISAGSGVYFYRLEAAGFRKSRKLLLLK